MEYVTRMSARTLMLAVALMSICGTAFATSPGRTVYKKATPSVVIVSTNTGSGSGFAFGRKGEYLTNAHVVAIVPGVPKAYSTVTIRDIQGNTSQATVLKVDFDRDVALLKSSDLQLPPLPPNSSPVETGDDAYAIGSPEGTQFTITSGQVSRAHSRNPDDPGKNFIQVSVPVNHGNSGGPVLNSDAEVIGIASEVKYEKNSIIPGVIPGSRTDGIAFAIPIKEAADSVGSSYRVVKPSPKQTDSKPAKTGSSSGITISKTALLVGGGGLVVLVMGVLVGVLLGRGQRRKSRGVEVPDSPPVVYRTPSGAGESRTPMPQPVPSNIQDDDFDIVIKPTPPDEPSGD